MPLTSISPQWKSGVLSSNSVPSQEKIPLPWSGQSAALHYKSWLKRQGKALHEPLKEFLSNKMATCVSIECFRNFCCIT